MNSIPRIIIVGGGFAGVACAQRLRRFLTPKEAEIILFDQNNHMVFSPLLAEVAGASINPDAVAVPLRQMLPQVHCRTEEVQAILPSENRLDYASLDGGSRTFSYDHLVLATGSVVNMGIIPGMADHAFPLKTIGDGMVLRSHVLQKMEAAEVCGTAERRRWHLSFLVVGGGFSGIEVAGEINDLVRGARKRFRWIEEKDIQVTVIHSRDHVLPEVTSPLRAFARREMERAKIKFVLGSRAAHISSQGVRLTNGQMLSGATVVATIGNAVSPLITALSLAKSARGLLVTDPDLRVQGSQNVWAIGDCSDNINAYDGQPAPWTGQFAEREGRQAAENLARTMRGEPTRPFSYRPMGQLCSIGGRRAVADIKGFQLSGFFAWFVWRGVYLFKMPTWSRRLKIGFDWFWDLLFARDLVYVRANVTERVASASFSAGDFVFREGDPATGFYVIETGEVEILRRVVGEPEPRVAAVLHEGDFFGELALLENRPHRASVRARKPLRVMVLSGPLFTRMSSSWHSIREVVAEARRQREAEQKDST